MKGLEEGLEYDEEAVEFQKRTALNISLIVIAVSNLLKDVSNYVNNKPLIRD
jgi:hypothetical protein